MLWNPEKYLQFKEIRFKPFFDLMQLISPDGLKNAVDIGCGTGEQTSILAARFEHTSFLGIDSSAEMLSKSEAFVQDNLKFQQTTTEAFAASDSSWDLIFSNAALQWSDDHPALFPKLIAKINPGGQFAVQMPFQKENALNQLLLEIVQEKPFVVWLNGFQQNSPVLDLDTYAQILFEHGMKDINVFLRIYPIIAKSEHDLYNFISGSALIPYMERLDPQQQEVFREEFLKKIRRRFSNYPAFYAFKRLLMHGVKVVGS